MLQDYKRLRACGIGFPAPKAHLANSAEFPVQKALSELHKAQKEEQGLDLILVQLGSTNRRDGGSINTEGRVG